MYLGKKSSHNVPAKISKYKTKKNYKIFFAKKVPSNSSCSLIGILKTTTISLYSNYNVFCNLMVLVFSTRALTWVCFSFFSSFFFTSFFLNINPFLVLHSKKIINKSCKLSCRRILGLMAFAAQRFYCLKKKIFRFALNFFFFFFFPSRLFESVFGAAWIINCVWKRVLKALLINYVSYNSDCGAQLDSFAWSNYSRGLLVSIITGDVWYKM